MGSRLYRDTGVVLRTHKLGEADRIVVLCTEQHGKVRAVARGVRKTKSRFGARLEPLTHVTLQIYEGRNLHGVDQVEVLDAFQPVREDLDRLGKAMTLLEVVDQVSQEEEPNTRLYQMLVGALRSLAQRDAPLLVPAFFWKLLVAEGTGPLLDACATCGEEEDLVAFDLTHGGTLCRTHRTGVPVSEAALALTRRILGGDLVAVLGEPASPVTIEVENLATRAIEITLERRLRSPHLLDR